MNLLTIKTMNDGSIIRSLKGVMVELITDDGHVKKCERFNKPVEIAPIESEVSA